jgi:hypothetical protein
MFDVFYLDKKPGLFAHEQFVNSIEEACSRSRTRFFWIVNYLCDYSEFDFLWEPPSWQQHQRHAWASQWHGDCGTYLVPRQGFTDTNYHDKKITTTADPTRWTNTVPDFDYSWHPDYRDPPYIYQFGTQWQATGGPRYSVPGAVDVKYIDRPRALKKTIDQAWHVPGGIDLTGFDLTWHPDDRDPPYIYKFGTQWQRAGGPEYHMPGATDIKFVSCQAAQALATQENWHVPDGVDVDNFDFSWHPNPNDPPFIYQFGTQWQKTGGPRYEVPGATEVKYTDQIRVESQAAVAVVIDHLDGSLQQTIQQIERQTSIVRCVRYVDNYLDTLRRIANNMDHGIQYVWICSSVCDYHDFDFSWHPEQWQATMLHVFASNDLKFGDTFFMHVPTFRDRSQTCKLLEWYDVNFLSESVPRRPIAVVEHSEDSHVDVIKQSGSRAPFTLYTVESVPDIVPAVNLWRNEVKAVMPLDRAGVRVIVPREAQNQIKQQVYDYAVIDKKHTKDNQCEPLDIVFISNGEPNADQNWGALLHRKQGQPNRCVRVDGVNGRAAAYHAAAEASETPWFFAVFAKLEVLADFDWAWQPDRLQQPKHYIFHALNPVNQLEYGHQAMIAYNKKLTLANPGRGLDFTLDDAHEVVPVLSGVAHYNVDAWTAWRTAFREVIKLRASLPDVENEYRMKQWLTVGSGPYGEFSCYGARDALDFYDEVSGDFAELRKSYEWAWLASYALLKRNLEPGQR